MSPEKISVLVRETIPNERRVPLEGLYLNQNLRGLAEKLGSPLVIANYVTDLDYIIATKGKSGDFEVAKELKNPNDWRLFQELTAQADVIITGAGYLNRFAKLGEAAENVLTQFDEGGAFEELGEWRLQKGYKSRNPDIAVVSRSLDFSIPESLVKSGREIIIFTTDVSASSDAAIKLKAQGATIVAAGTDGVDGKIMIDHLGSAGYKVIKMTTGPRVLDILLKAGVLNRLYITRVNRNITYDDPSEVIRVLLSGGKVSELPGFTLTQRYIDENIVTKDWFKTSQEFLVYDKSK